MKTLVTGGAGFIGSHLVNRLLENGDDVVVLDSLEGQVHQGRPPAMPSDVEFLLGDVGDFQLAGQALSGVDRVVHLGAVVGVGQSMYEIARYVRQNTQSTASFLECMVNQRERPSRLVVASSMSIYGEGEYECPDHGRVAPGPRPEDQLLARNWECTCPSCGAQLAPVGTRETKPLIPTSVYAVTKRDHEELCLVVGRAYAIDSVALRFFNVYGPGQALSNPYTGVAAIFASSLMNERAPLIFEDGRQSRDFIHVSDIVQGIVCALESDDAVGLAVNLGTGNPSTVEQVAEALSAGLGTQVNLEPTGRYRAGDIRHCYASTELAREVLDFRAAIGLEEGMKDLINWLGEQTDVSDGVERAAHELEVRGLAH